MIKKKIFGIFSFLKIKKAIEKPKPIFIPMAVLNNGFMIKKNGDSFTQNRHHKIAVVPQSNKTKKIKHPSGTMMIRFQDYQSIPIEGIEGESNHHQNTKLIRYQEPNYPKKSRKPKERSHWRY